MTKIIKSNFGVRFNSEKVAKGSVSSVQKNGSFYTFSLRLSKDDIREFSFSDFERAVKMRKIMISHVERKITIERKKLSKQA